MNSSYTTFKFTPFFNKTEMSWGRLQKRKSKVAQFMNKHYFH